MQAGYAEYLAIRQRLNLPLLETGAIVVAWSEAELARLDAIEAQAHGNGVRRRAPAGSSRAAGPRARAGAGCPGRPAGARRARHRPLVGAAGLSAAGGRERCRGLVRRRAVGRRPRARPMGARHQPGPRLGPDWSSIAPDFMATSSSSACWGRRRSRSGRARGSSSSSTRRPPALLHSIVLPVPTERTKGVVLARTIFGNLLVGPTADEQEERDRAAVDQASLAELVAKAVAMVPALAGMPVTATYAGLRPATEHKEYRVRQRPERQWLTLGGIRSTGLTAALGLAQHAWRLSRDTIPHPTSVAAPVWPSMPNLAEHRATRLGDAGPWRDRLSLRAGDPARDRCGAGRAAAGTRSRRPQAPDPGRHGPLPGLLLQRADRGADPRPADAGAGGRGRAWLSLSTDVAIVGGGPAGLAAAIALRGRGVARVTVLEREATAGGVPRHCGHPPFGMRELGRVLTGPAYARRLVAMAMAAGADIRTGTCGDVARARRPSARREPGRARGRGRQARPAGDRGPRDPALRPAGRRRSATGRADHRRAAGLRSISKACCRSAGR